MADCRWASLAITPPDAAAPPNGEILLIYRVTEATERRNRIARAMPLIRYRARVKLIEGETGNVRWEGELRAFEHVVNVCGAARGVDVETAKAMVQAAVKGN